MNLTGEIRFLVFLLCATMSFSSSSQNRVAAQQTISDLCTEDMAGRGYILSGEKKAADYISSRFKSIGLKPATQNYHQFFTISVNTIIKTEVKQEGRLLVTGEEYVIAPESGSVNINGPLFYVTEKMLNKNAVVKKVKRAIERGFIPVIDQYNTDNIEAQNTIEEIKNSVTGAALIFLKDKLTWSVGRAQSKNGEVWILSSAFNRMAKRISITIESKFIEQYTTQNVYGYVAGTDYPDSFIIFCGHYDHLGKMGNATFYGANDNASGISLLLDMATYFVHNPQKYSIAFIAFGAEEAGLLGSLHYVKNPIVALSKTKFVFNMDLMGTGELGATIVNGSVYPKAFATLTKINTANGYLPKIKSRGKAANSDHYFFSEMGVPSFFMYLMGDYQHYHTPADNAKNLVLGEYYDKSFLLIRDFIHSFSSNQ